MKSFLHRLLFILLVFPLGLILCFNITIKLFIEVIKWIFTGDFNDEFILELSIVKVIEFFEFDKLLE